MEFYNNFIIILVTVALLISSIFVMFLMCKSNSRNDATVPLLISVFSAGLTQGIMGVMAVFTSLLDLQDNHFMLQCYFFMMLISVYSSYLSLAFLSAIKLFAVLKPFTFQTAITTRRMIILSFSIWTVCIACASPVLFSPNVVIYSDASKTPKFNTEVKITSKVLKVLGLPVLYGAMVVLLLSSLGLYIITIKHAINIQLRKRGYIHDRNQGPMQVLMTRVIITALWEAKGVMVLSLVRLTTHLPFFLLGSARNSSHLAFYFQWYLFCGPFLDVICFIGCSKTLRHLALVTCSCEGLLACRCGSSQVRPTSNEDVVPMPAQQLNQDPVLNLDPGPHDQVNSVCKVEVYPEPQQIKSQSNEQVQSVPELTETQSPEPAHKVSKQADFPSQEPIDSVCAQITPNSDGVAE